MTSSDEGGYLDVNEFLKLVIGFERAAALFYRELREKHEKTGVKSLLEMLEAEELKHAKVLMEFEKTGEAEGYIQFPPEILLSMPPADDPDLGIDELMDIAIERERRAALIYENAASMMSGSFKELLEGLAAFEKEHEEKLQSFRSYY
jgi:rubrerythrin